MTNQNNTVWDNILSWQKDIQQKDEQLNKRKPLHDQLKPQATISSQTTTSAFSNNNTTTSTKKTIIQRALEAKEKGNHYFQQRQYHEAIKCYTEAIDLDPTNATYFVNRAMAEIKLNRFLQAEKDCSNCLLLQPNHVKALWRRGIARNSLGRPNEARQDFELALKIEPGNKAITDELNKLPKSTIIKQNEAEQLSKGQQSKDQILKSDPMLRRLNINIIDEEYVPNKRIHPSDSKSNKVETNINSMKEIKEQSINTKIEDSTTPIQKQKQTENTTAIVNNNNNTTTTTTLPSIKIKCPNTNYEFERDWKSCKKRGDETLYQYLQCIPPTSFATLFKSSLEPDQFEKIIEIIHEYYLKNNRSEDVLQMMDGLSHIGRLDMLVMFLGKKHKTAIQDIFIYLKNDNTSDRTTISTLAKKFSLSNI
ncbi:unnamed protein product [Cunninghamella blakesleeana]